MYRMFELFITWRRRVLLTRVARHVEYGAVEYASASYLCGLCRGEPRRVWIKQGTKLVEDEGSTKIGPPKIHLDVWFNRILVDDIGFLSGSSYVLYPFGIKKTIGVS